MSAWMACITVAWFGQTARAQGEILPDVKPAAIEQRVAALELLLKDSDRKVEVVRDRETTILALIAIANRESKGGGDLDLLKLALLELGNYPDSPRALRTLSSMIDVQVSELLNPGRPLDGYPAAEALIKIGSPARRYVIGGSTPAPNHVLHLRAHVLAKIEQTGDDWTSGPPVAVFRLTRELERVVAETVPAEHEEFKESHIKKLKRMIGLLIEPGFLSSQIPFKAAEAP